jgi:sulfur carrier protein
MITLNGENVHDAEGLNVLELLTREGYPTKLVAVECNGSIIPRNTYESHRFAEGDSVEVVRFVGGGSL